MLLRRRSDNKRKDQGIFGSICLKMQKKKKKEQSFLLRGGMEFKFNLKKKKESDRVFFYSYIFLAKIS